jgi:Plant transposon protein
MAFMVFGDCFEGREMLHFLPSYSTGDFSKYFKYGLHIAIYISFYAMIAALVAAIVIRCTILILRKLKRGRKKARKQRNSYPRQDPRTRPFYTDYLSPDVRAEVSEAGSRLGKIFRRRFRVPFAVFLNLLNKTEELGFIDHRSDITGRYCVPLGSKLLGVLRVLGRGVCFDDIAELAGGSEEMHRVFFHKWCKLFSHRFFDEHVYPPRTAEEVHRNMAVYRRLGLNGAIGSTDCTHVRWERCPYSIANVCTGKEGFATLAYHATVNHHLEIMALQTSKYGSYNDQTICRYDEFIHKIRSGVVYADVKYDLYDSEGRLVEHTSPYIIADGGFLKWRALICGYKQYSNVQEAIWSAQMESTRKDVERFFGILKGRFRCLKLPIYVQSQDKIDNMFATCCILHNIILRSDGRDRLWEEEVNWGGEDGQHEEIEGAPNENRNRRGRELIRRRALHKLEDWSRVGRQHPQLERDTEEVEPGFFEFRRELINHYYYLFKNRRDELEWLN